MNTCWLATLMMTAATPDGVDLKAVVDAKMSDWLAAGPVASAAVAYISNGEVRWTAAYGEAKPGVAATEATLYNVASLTKPVAAEAILRLAASAKIDLDEPMHRHWVDPDVAHDPRHRVLTPRLALSHRTGLPNWRSGGKDGRLAFSHPPGTRPGYSGEGYEYVGRFVERKLKRSFEAVVRAYVFEPLGLRNTALTGQPWFESAVVAWPQGPDGQRRPPDIRKTWSAADDLVTTVGDYARFVRSVMRNEGLSASLARQRLRVERPRFREQCPWGPKGCPVQVGFGLGWAVFDYGTERVVLQGGADWGERALALFVPEREVGIVVLTNSAHGGKVVLEVVRALYDNPAFHRFLAFQAK